MISDLDKDLQKRDRLFSPNQSSIGITLKNLLEKGLNENEILKIKKYIDITEGNNVIESKELVDMLVTDPLVPKSQNIIIDKMYSIAQILNQRIC